MVAKKMFKPTDSIDDIIAKSGPSIVNKVTGEVVTDGVLASSLSDFSKNKLIPSDLSSYSKHVQDAY